MNVYEKLLAIQAELKAPKNRQNEFGGYSYRSCEDILEAVKPLLKKYKAIIRLNDRIEQIGDRYYVNAQAFFYDLESEDGVTCAEAYAREPEEKKGMDAAQITGTSSSYARKYALNALLLIDDVKDADSNEFREEQEAKANRSNKQKKTEASEEVAFDALVSAAQVTTIERMLEKADVPAEKFCTIYKITNLTELPADQYDDAVKKLETAISIKKKGE
jgi:hypothetical protein